MKRKLKLAGFFVETHPFLLRGARTSLPSFHDLLGAIPSPEKSNILRFLMSGTDFGYISSRPIVKCPEDVFLNSFGSVFTDGTWAWPSELAYYVNAFDLALPGDFQAHMEASGWQAHSDVDCGTLEW